MLLVLIGPALPGDVAGPNADLGFAACGCGVHLGNSLSILSCRARRLAALLVASSLAVSFAISASALARFAASLSAAAVEGAGACTAPALGPALPAVAPMPRAPLASPAAALGDVESAERRFFVAAALDAAALSFRFRLLESSSLLELLVLVLLSLVASAGGRREPIFATDWGSVVIPTCL